MKTKIIKTIAQTAIMAALTFVCTIFVSIPYGGGAGYFNLSDAIILFSTIYFGPIVGITSGILGTTLGDLASGFAVFAPFTLLAKGLEAILCFLIFYFLRKTKYVKYISIFVSPLIMVASYFMAYNILFDMNAALVSSGFDLIQGIAGSIIGFTLVNIFERTPIEHFNWETFNLFKRNKALLVK